MGSELLLVTDADNTLWDTDSVYAEAQLSFLKRAEERSGRASPINDRLAFVRELDQGIAVSHESHLRYPPELLFMALLHRLAGASAADAIAYAAMNSVSRQYARFEHDVSEFQQQLCDGIPRLRPGVQEFFHSPHIHQTCVIVATESDLDRCARIVRKHELDAGISAIEVGSKLRGLFATISRKYRASRQFAVGDQLDRDIRPAHDAGFVTIHFPSAFMPFWQRDEDSASVDFRIASFAELPTILNRRPGEVASRIRPSA